jgi:4-carboxymuconolactone decarboxylase
MLLRIAALASVGAAPTSYAANLGAADEFGVDPEKVQGTLVAIAPVVGTARAAEAALAIATTLGGQIPIEGLGG